MINYNQPTWTMIKSNMQVGSDQLWSNVNNFAGTQDDPDQLPNITWSIIILTWTMIKSGWLRSTTKSPTMHTKSLSTLRVSPRSGNWWPQYDHDKKMFTTIWSWWNEKIKTDCHRNPKLIPGGPDPQDHHPCQPQDHRVHNQGDYRWKWWWWWWWWWLYNVQCTLIYANYHLIISRTFLRSQRTTWMCRRYQRIGATDLRQR